MEQPLSDYETLRALLLQPPGATPIPGGTSDAIPLTMTTPSAPTSSAPSTTRVSRPRGRRADSIGVPEGIAACILFLAFWIGDGYFSLVALMNAGIPIKAVLGWPWQLTFNEVLPWSIPLLIEVIEQRFLGAKGWGLAAFLIVSIPNACAAAYGIYVQLNIAAPLNIETDWTLMVLLGISGTLLAFVPGRGVMWALHALIAHGRG
jgi:hypothetical protein